ncbi:MAG: adenosylmethionine decarboxylase [Planctomycetota bacterium]
MSVHSTTNAPEDAPEDDYFRVVDGVRCAGAHVIVDFWGATRLDDPAFVERALKAAAEAAGAQILHSHTHHFSPYGGVTGVVVLAESHISIHTWPERGFAAIDIFMCGDCDPRDALPTLTRAFSPEHAIEQTALRGESD